MGLDMKRLIKWLIRKYLPGYHLARNPTRKVVHEPDGDNPGLEGVATEGPEGVSE